MYSVSDYVDSKRSLSTKRNVISVFVRYFRYVNDGQDVENLAGFSLEYITSERDFFLDVKGYVDDMILSGLAPKTMSNHFMFVRHWLSWNGITFDPVQKSILSGKMPRAVSIHDEDFFDKEKLSSLLSHSDILLRAIVLILSSSGMRIGECLAFTPEQLQGNEIHMRADQMKARKPHVYFVSTEALQAVEEWKKVRSEYLRLADLKTRKCLGRVLENSSELFPLSYMTVRVKFENAMRRAGILEKDTVMNRSRITLHSIRKWTDSTMKMYISSNLANALIGHFEPGDTSYRRYTREQLRETYAKVEPRLVILAPEGYAELASDTQKQLASHDKLLVGLMEDNYQMKQDNKVIKDTLDSLVRYLESGK